MEPDAVQRENKPLECRVILLGALSLFVLREIVETDEGHLNFSVGSTDNIAACLFVGDTVDIVDQVNPSRNDPDGQNVSCDREAFEG